MSGPKVVRVVTREELVSAGRALLARLDAAIKQWERNCGSLLKDSDVEATKGRRDDLATILAADKFPEFVQAAAKEIDFLMEDVERRRDRAVQARAQERVRHASGQELAKTLLRSGATLPPDLRVELEKASQGQLSVAEMDTALSRAGQAVFLAEREGVTPEQRELAQRLGAQATGATFETWRLQSEKPDARLQVAFVHLSDLEALGFSSDASSLERELHLVNGIADDAKRNMRMDTILQVVRRAKGDALAKVKLVSQIELMAAELSATAPASDAVRKLQAASLTASLEQLQEIIELGREQLARSQAAGSAAARRKAVLEGLQKLGYQLQEGISTITTDSGRLVVRSPGESGYGVELVMGASQKVQVRSVSFNTGRDMSQDVAEEQRWCGDFSKLQVALQSSGCEVVVEKALGVGAAPLRVVEVTEDRGRRQAAPGQAGRGS